MRTAAVDLPLSCEAEAAPVPTPPPPPPPASPSTMEADDGLDGSDDPTMLVAVTTLEAEDPNRDAAAKSPGALLAEGGPCPPAPADVEAGPDEAGIG